MYHHASIHENKKKKPSGVLLIDSDGLSNYTCYLARGLSLYCDVILYGFSYQSYNITGASRQKGIKFYYLKKRLPKGYSTLRGIVRVFLLFFILLNAFFRTKYDIVHIQEHLPTFFLFILMLKIRKKRICWTLHDVCLRPSRTGLLGKLEIWYVRAWVQPSLLRR